MPREVPVSIYTEKYEFGPEDGVMWEIY